MVRIRAAIAGGSGYTAGELLRLLSVHPQVDVAAVLSRSLAGQRVREHHDGTDDLGDLVFSERLGEDPDVLFLALPHGEAADFLASISLSSRTTVIDLSADHRLHGEAQGFLYGLTEDVRPRLASLRERGSHIANPGCFATAIQLGLLPLLRAGALRGDIHTSAVTGSTGAGRAANPTVHFSWRSGNMQVYKPFTHQHLEEIRATLARHQPGFDGAHYFIPYRGPFTRGIIATSYTVFEGSATEAADMYRTFCADEPFLVYGDDSPALKQVVNTNLCRVGTNVEEGMIIVTTVIDNLLKGAAGQAVQNMNLAFGLDERSGLRLKASTY